MLTVKVNGKKHTIPSCREDLTVNQYQKLFTEWKDDDVIYLFSILTGIEVSEIKGIKDVHNQNTIFSVVDFIFKSDLTFKDVGIPKTIAMSGGHNALYKVDIYLSSETLTLEQAIHLRQKIDQSKTLNECVGFAAAIFLQPLFNEGEFSLSKANELYEDEILNMPAYQIFPIGFFFLKPYKRNGTVFTEICNLTLTTLTRGRRQLRRWLRWAG